MKTTLELPDELMRAVKVRAAASDRKLKDVIAEAIARGLGAIVGEEDSQPPAVRAPAPRARSLSTKTPTETAVLEKGRGARITREQLDAIFAAGDELTRQGFDFKAWAKHSRDVWR